MNAHSQSRFLFDRRAVRIALMLMTIVLGVVYFVQITQASARGVALRRLTQQKSSLDTELYRMERTIAESSSAHNLQKRVAELGLTAARSIEYIQPDIHSVAVR